MRSRDGLLNKPMSLADSDAPGEKFGQKCVPELCQPRTLLIKLCCTAVQWRQFVMKLPQRCITRDVETHQLEITSTQLHERAAVRSLKHVRNPAAHLLKQEPQVLSPTGPHNNE